MRRHILLLTFVMVMTLAGLALSQTGSSPEISHYQGVVADYKSTVDLWEREAYAEIALTVSVIVFGALITVLQGSTKSWCRTATVVLGAATSIFAGLNARVFSADYRVLQESAIDAKALIRDMDGDLDILRSLWLAN